MGWFEEVEAFLTSNIESYAQHFFGGNKKIRRNKKGLQINPCPNCGHNDCFNITYAGYAKCFSCELGSNKGISLINLVKLLEGEENYVSELESFTGIKYNRKPMSPEKKAEYDKQKRLDEIYNLAVEFYHLELFSNEEALRRQTGSNLANKERQHTREALAHFRVGYSEKGSWATFIKQMYDKGYTRDEVSEAGRLVRIPPGLFVYPCFNVAGKLIRINTKLLYRSCYGDPEDYKKACTHYTYDLSKDAQAEHEKATGHKMVANGFSRGLKEAFFGSYDDLKRRKSFKAVLLVEGENDAITAWEALQGTRFEREIMVQCIGGNIGEEALEHPNFAYLHDFERMLEAFDHDKKGVEAYRPMFNRVFTEIPYATVRFGEDDYDGLDIDDYLKTARLDQLEVEALFENTIPIAPDDKFVNIQLVDRGRVTNGAPKHTWVVKNRKGAIRFGITMLKGRAGNQQLSGDIELYKGNDTIPYDMKPASPLATLRLGADFAMNNLKIHLLRHLTTFYEELPSDEDGMPVRSDDELLTAYPFSKYKQEITKQLARRLLIAQQNGEANFDDMVSHFKGAIGNTAFEAVRLEMTAILNSNVIVEPGKQYKTIQLSSNFDVENDHALFYYVKHVQDDDAIAAIPCVISNHKVETRLDLLKRREKTHMLLIENKYQMPNEVESAPLRMEDCSLQPHFVEMWKNDEIDPKDLEPAKLIDEIREMVESVYYFRDSNVPKVIALWIYGTYFYTMFGAYPYLELSGRKGSGKSTLDTILTHLSLNARMSASATPAAIYRSLNIMGGTVVLDEMEGIFDKSKNDSSDWGPILKTGYSQAAGLVLRMDMELGEVKNFCVYGPKVISSINGMDDVLRDRSITITTHPAPKDLENKPIDISLFSTGDRLQQIYSLSSRCVLSAMTHFKRLASVYRELQTDSQLDRLSQIMDPLLAVSLLADESYNTALTEFYNTEIKASKLYTLENTLEGRMKSILRLVALELTGIEPPPLEGGYTSKFRDTNDETLFTQEITYNRNNQTIEINSIHFKLLVEGWMDTVVPLEDLHKQARLLLGSQTRANERSRRTSMTIKNDTLSRMFGGKPRIYYYTFTFDVSECLDEADLARMKQASQNLLQEDEAPF